MDKLEFRRQAYANPLNREQEFMDAAQTSPQNQQFLQDLNQLNAKLTKAMQVDEPAGLAARLLLNPQLAEQ